MIKKEGGLSTKVIFAKWTTLFYPLLRWTTLVLPLRYEFIIVFFDFVRQKAFFFAKAKRKREKRGLWITFARWITLKNAKKKAVGRWKKGGFILRCGSERLR